MVFLDRLIVKRLSNRQSFIFFSGANSNHKSKDYESYLWNKKQKSKKN